MNSIISRYIFKEFIPPFFLNVLFLLFIFLLTRILDIMNMIVNYKVGIYPIFRMIVYLMPYFCIYVIPMSVMMSVLLTFLRMSSDNEIIALKASGASIYDLMPPVLIFSIFGCIITLVLTIYGTPWGRISSKQLMFEMASSTANITLKEKTFIDSFKDVMLYINEIDIKNKTLTDIFIEDQRSKNAVITVIAPKGKLYSDPTSQNLYIMLYNGMMNQVDLKNRSVNSIRFESYELNLDVGKAISDVRMGPKTHKDMYLSELIEYIYKIPVKNKEYYNALMEFHKKFSIPFASIFMSILAVPLGVQSKYSGRSVGFSLGMASFLLYYLLLSVGQVFGETGRYPPAIGMWVPNIVMGGIGIYLLVKSSK